MTNDTGAVPSVSCSFTPGAYVPTKYTYTITYNDNGGSGGPGYTTITGTSSTLSTNIASGTPSRSGYTFKHWNTKSDGSGSSYSPGSKISVSSDITLYAIWEQIPKYYIYFYKDNTETYPSNIAVAPSAHTWVYSGGSFTLPGNIVSKAQTNNGPYTVIFVPANGNSNITSSYYNRTKYTQNGWAYHNTTT